MAAPMNESIHGPTRNSFRAWKASEAEAMSGETTAWTRESEFGTQDSAALLLRSSPMYASYIRIVSISVHLRHLFPFFNLRVIQISAKTYHRWWTLQRNNLHHIQHEHRRERNPGPGMQFRLLVIIRVFHVVERRIFDVLNVLLLDGALIID